jgi:hypothetical protein
MSKTHSSFVFSPMQKLNHKKSEKSVPKLSEKLLRHQSEKLVTQTREESVHAKGRIFKLDSNMFNPLSPLQHDNQQKKVLINK